jgi:hypothetical protein
MTAEILPSDLRDDETVRVCAHCKRACCHQGEYMCRADDYPAELMTVKHLRQLARERRAAGEDGESEDWWSKDVGVIDRRSIEGRHVLGGSLH